MMSSAVAVRGQLASALSRLGELLDEETTALQQSRIVDHTVFAARKDMIAFELGALARLAASVVPDDGLRLAYNNLSCKLEQNRKLLQIHIGASRQIALLLNEVMKAAESDGTYSVAQAQRVRP